MLRLVYAFLIGGLLMLLVILFIAYCIGCAIHWAPGDPEPSFKGFMRDLGGCLVKCLRKKK